MAEAVIELIVCCSMMMMKRERERESCLYVNSKGRVSAWSFGALCVKSGKWRGQKGAQLTDRRANDKQ